MTDIVNATQAMLRAVGDEPMPRTVRAIAAVENGRLLGVTGFYPQNGHLVVFAGMTQEMRADIGRHRRTIVRCARRLIKMVLERGLPACAYADPDIPGSDSLLTHLGFAHEGHGIYVWHGPH